MAGAPRLTHRYQTAMQTLRRQWEPKVAADVAAYLRGALARTLATVPKAAIPSPPPAPSEAAILRRTLGPWYRRALGRLQDTAEGMGIAGELHDVTTAQYLAEAGTRIRGIAETTRQQVTAALTDGYARHEGYDVLARRLRTLPAFSDTRARLIAKTELSSATNLAALYVYDASPAVDGVLIYDGTGDPICAPYAGRRVSLTEARDVPLLGHPACRRSFAPLIDYRGGA